MSNILHQTLMGARILPPEAVSEADLGPLQGLVGQWQGSSPTQSTGIANGWNVISVPGPGVPDFTFEVIPYTESLTFSAAVIQAGNRGPVLNGNQVDQTIYGLIYEQQIVSAAPEGSVAQKRGFPSGAAIHAETGLLLYLGAPTGGYTIARLATIPHGNALLALGSSSQQTNPGTTFIPAVSAEPTNLDGSQVPLLDYIQQITPDQQFPGIFNQQNPNSFLTTTLQALVGNGILTSMTTIEMNTAAPNTDGGILNIPFLANNVSATSMTATFWLEEINGGSASTQSGGFDLLQYSQTINLVFPPTNLSLPIVWPHITVNTLVRVK